MANKIDTEIRLLGAEEIKRILAQLGITGEKAFQQVSEAVDKGNAKLQRYFSAIEQLSNSVQRVGEAGRSFGTAFNNLNTSMDKLGSSATFTAKRIAIVGGAISGAAIAAFAFVKSATNAADEIIKQAQAVGLSVEAYQRLSFAASQAGVDQQQFATGIARFSQEATKAAQEARAALAGFANEVVTSLDRANVKTIGFGSTATATFQQISDAAAHVQQQLRARGIELPIGAITDQLVKLATGTAEMRKQFDLLNGRTLATSQTALEKLGLEGDKSASALQRLGIRVLDSQGNLRGLEDLLGDVAEAFSKMPDSVEKVSLVADLFGRRSGPRFLSLLAAGRKGVQELAAEFDKSALKITEAEGKMAEDANDAFSFMIKRIDDVRAKLGVLFAPALQQGADAFRQIIERNADAILKFGARISGQVLPVLLDLVKLLEGRSFEVENKWLITLLDGIHEFGAAVKNAVTNIIIPAFGALQKTLDVVANTFNRVFGTEFTGGQLLAAAAIAKLLGLFGLLGSAIAVVGNAIVVFGRGLVLLIANLSLVASVIRVVGVTLAAITTGPGLLIGAVLVASALLVIRHWEQVRGLFGSFFGIIGGIIGQFGQLNTAVQGLIALLVGRLLVALGIVRAASILAWGPIIAGLTLLVLDFQRRVDELAGKAKEAGLAFDAEFQNIINAGQKVSDSLAKPGDAANASIEPAKRLARGIHDVQTELAQIGTRNVAGISDLPKTFDAAAQGAAKSSTEINAQLSKISATAQETKRNLDLAFAGPPEGSTTFLNTVPVIDTLIEKVNTAIARLQTLQESLQNVSGFDAGGAGLGAAGGGGGGFGAEQESFIGQQLRLMREFLQQVNPVRTALEQLKNLFISPASAAEGVAEGSALAGLGFDPTVILAQLNQMQQAVANSWATIVNTFNVGSAAAANTFDLMIRGMLTAAQAIGSQVSQTFSGVFQAVTQAFGGIPSLVQNITQQVVAAVSSMLQQIQAVADQAIAALSRVIETAKAASKATGGAVGGGGFASGGYTGSIGTTRIAGVVHGGEYVQPARVVARPGVFDFMEVLRRTGDLRATIDRFTRGFSFGGFVDSMNASLALASPLALPRFQTGGLVPANSGGRHHGSVDLTLGGPGGRQTFRVYAPDATAEALTKFATLERMRSTGSPSWER